MRSHYGSDTVNGILIFLHVREECGIHRLFQRGKTLIYLYYSCAENLHSGYIRCLLLDVYRTHVNVALHAEVCCCGSQSHTVLSGTGLCNNLLLSHVFRKKHLTHAVV